MPTKKNIPKVFKIIKSFLFEFFFPVYCLSCRRYENFLCHDCYHGLEFSFRQISVEELKNSLGEVYFDEVLILAQFRKPFSLLIKALKYRHARNIAPFLAQMLYQHLQIPPADLLTFIPVHPLRLAERGYNQSQAIAQEYSYICKIPLINLLERKKHLSAQAKVANAQDRIARMDEVFQLRRNKKLTGKTILLIDDVFTTGATVNAAAKELKKTAVAKIIVIVLASKKD